jgi:hypothetical protein
MTDINSNILRNTIHTYIVAFAYNIEAYLRSGRLLYDNEVQWNPLRVTQNATPLVTSHEFEHVGYNVKMGKE